MAIYHEIIRFVENGLQRRILHKDGTNQLFQEQKGRMSFYIFIDSCSRPYVEPDNMKTPEAKYIYEFCQQWLERNNGNTINA